MVAVTSSAVRMMGLAAFDFGHFDFGLESLKAGRVSHFDAEAIGRVKRVTAFGNDDDFVR